MESVPLEQSPTAESGEIIVEVISCLHARMELEFPENRISANKQQHIEILV
jgi:hypothetical protein